MVIEMKFIENEHCELKSILTKDIKKEIVAFANTSGGKIYVGIDDVGKVIGVNNADDDLQSLTGMINEGIKPSLIAYTQINIEEFDKKDVIVIDIENCPNKPYYLADKGLKPSGVYLRHGSSLVQASDEIIKKMILEHSSLRFEEMVSKNQNLTFEYLQRKFKENDLEFDESKYKILNIVNDDNLYTNLALLLSDECPYTIKTALFDGINKIKFLDRKEFTGSIISQVDEAFDYLKLINKLNGEIVDIKRVDLLDYPVYALREALLNAVIHQSFYFEASVFTSIYDDRVEIVSMGGLINGINIEEIFKGISSTRNPNLANIFYRLGYVESFGTGVGRIMDCYESFSKKPIFDATENTFSIALPNRNYNNITKTVTPKESNEQVVSNYIKKYGKINRIDVEKLLNISKTRAYTILDKMYKNKIVIKKGNGRSTYYTLNEGKL